MLYVFTALKFIIYIYPKKFYVINSVNIMNTQFQMFPDVRLL